MTGLETGWRDLVSGQARAWWAPAARAGLSVLAAPYAGVISSYRALFDLGLIRPARLPCAVIAVGNITVGGTGKTTTVRWLVRALQSAGLRPAILSRGYRAGEADGQAVEDVRIVASREAVLMDAKTGGDEPVLLARSLPGVPVLIGRKRVLTGRRAWDEFRPDALVLDDAFQYWRLQKDLEIVLLDATNPYGHGGVFPRGMLREPLRGLRRAHAAILTHAASVSDAERARLRADLRRRMPEAVIAEARHLPVRLRDHRTGVEVPLAELREGSWIALSGLGRPQAFEETLRELGAGSVEPARFPDHHPYTFQETQALAERAKSKGMAGVVTTEKDAVKIESDWLGDARCLVLEIDLDFLSGRQELEQLLRQRVMERKSE